MKTPTHEEIAQQILDTVALRNGGAEVRLVRKIAAALKEAEEREREVCLQVLWRRAREIRGGNETASDMEMVLLRAAEEIAKRRKP